MTNPVFNRRNKDAVMGLGEHLEELRSRIIWGILGLIPILIIALIYADSMMKVLLGPLFSTLDALGQPMQVQNTGVLEGFSSYMKFSLVATVIVGVPWILYQAWKFVAPGLYEHERRFVYVLAPLSVVMMVLGMLTLYFVMLPLALNYLVNFGITLIPQSVATAPLPPEVVLPKPLPLLTADPPSPEIGQMWINTGLHSLRIALPTPDGAGIEVRGMPLTGASLVSQQYRVKEYFDLLYSFGIAFAIAYQLPVVVLLLGWAGIVTRQFLRKYWRHAAAACTIIAAIVSPTPDPVSFLAMLIPLYGLYELGIILLWLLPASRVAGKRRGEGLVSMDPAAAEG